MLCVCFLNFFRELNHCLRQFLFVFSTDDAVCVELTQFKEQFKAHLHGVIRHVIKQLNLAFKLSNPTKLFFSV